MKGFYCWTVTLLFFSLFYCWIGACVARKEHYEHQKSHAVNYKPACVYPCECEKRTGPPVCAYGFTTFPNQCFLDLHNLKEGPTGKRLRKYHDGPCHPDEYGNHPVYEPPKAVPYADFDEREDDSRDYEDEYGDVSVFNDPEEVKELRVYKALYPPPLSYQPVIGQPQPHYQPQPELKPQAYPAPVVNQPNTEKIVNSSAPTSASVPAAPSDYSKAENFPAMPFNYVPQKGASLNKHVSKIPPAYKPPALKAGEPPKNQTGYDSVPAPVAKDPKYDVPSPPQNYEPAPKISINYEPVSAPKDPKYDAPAPPQNYEPAPKYPEKYAPAAPVSEYDPEVSSSNYEDLGISSANYDPEVSASNYDLYSSINDDDTAVTVPYDPETETTTPYYEEGDTTPLDDGADSTLYYEPETSTSDYNVEAPAPAVQSQSQNNPPPPKPAAVYNSTKLSQPPSPPPVSSSPYPANGPSPPVLSPVPKNNSSQPPQAQPGTIQLPNQPSVASSSPQQPITTAYKKTNV